MNGWMDRWFSLRKVSRMSQHINAPKHILFLYLSDYNFKQNKNFCRVKQHYWKDPDFSKQGDIWEGLLQCSLIQMESPHWSLCTTLGRRGTAYKMSKITMPILKERTCLIGETVQCITREYFLSWAAPWNVRVQVRDRKRNCQPPPYPHSHWHREMISSSKTEHFTNFGQTWNWHQIYCRLSLPGITWYKLNFKSRFFFPKKMHCHSLIKTKRTKETQLIKGPLWLKSPKPVKEVGFLCQSKQEHGPLTQWSLFRV